MVNYTKNIKSVETPATPNQTSVYETASASMVNQAEEWVRFGHSELSLSNYNFGGSGQLQISSQDNLLRACLELVLPAEPTAVVNGGISLCQYWGYHCIRDVEITPSNSNISIRYTGEMLLAMAIAQTESREKLDSVLSFSGKRQIKNTAATDYNEWNNYQQVAIVDLNVLFMNMHTSDADCSKGYPLDIVPAPWQLVVSFKNLNEFCNFAPGTDVSGFGNGFVSAKLRLRTSQFTDKSFSLKNSLMSNPQSVYPISFTLLRQGGIHNQTMSRVSATNKLTSTRMHIDLNAVDNADLLAIMFTVVESASIAKTVDIPLDPAKYLGVTDLEVLWNGQVLYRSKGTEHLLVSQFTSGKHGSIGFSHEGLNGVDATQTGAPMRQRNMIQIDMSRISFSTCARSISNTVRYLSSQMSVSFNIITERDTGAAVDYVCRYYYAYPALLLTSSTSTSIELQ